MVRNKYKNKKKTISKMPGSKLKSKLNKKFDPEVEGENYQIIMAEIENEYNDLLLS